MGDGEKISENKRNDICLQKEISIAPKNFLKNLSINSKKFLESTKKNERQRI